jgi:hypothetical protein
VSPLDVLVSPPVEKIPQLATALHALSHSLSIGRMVGSYSKAAHG